MPKVLLINGSPRPHQCTVTALSEMIKVFSEEGIETELIHVGNGEIRGCTACGWCMENDGCVFKDAVNATHAKLESADGLVIGSPVYYGSPNGTLISFLDRLFYSAPYDMHMKVGAAVVTATSTYWNQVHGFTAEDVRKDAEGMQTMRNLARNMSFMIRAIADAKEKYGKPVMDRASFTSFSDGKF